MFKILVGVAESCHYLQHLLQAHLVPILAPVMPLARPIIPTEIFGPAHMTHASLRCAPQETTAVKDLKSMLAVVADQVSAQTDTMKAWSCEWLLSTKPEPPTISAQFLGEITLLHLLHSCPSPIWQFSPGHGPQRKQNRLFAPASRLQSEVVGRRSA